MAVDLKNINKIAVWFQGLDNNYLNWVLLS